MDGVFKVSSEPSHSSAFHESETIHHLKHYLPAQAPLKDFIHHNTLHAFQGESFFKALSDAKQIFGYNSTLSIDEFRELYTKKYIRKDILEEVVRRRKGSSNFHDFYNRLFHDTSEEQRMPRIGRLRSLWKSKHHIDLDSLVQPTLFRVLASYLDQGVSMWNFPVWNHGFLASVKQLEKNSFASFFRGQKARQLLLSGQCGIGTLLEFLVGEKSLFETYLFDQQFSHPGWSGIVSTIEDEPHTLLDSRKISLKEVIIFELLLELDAVDYALGEGWSPLGSVLEKRPEDLFAPVPISEEQEILSIWQEAFEWTYFDDVLAGIGAVKKKRTVPLEKTFQAMFCLDDRECSLRRYIEDADPSCETFGTPGFFGVEFFYKPEHGKFYTKLCPAPVTPKYLIKELGSSNKHQKDMHFSKHSHSLFRGWLISYTLGFWSALKLFMNIFRPSVSPATAASFRHMDEFSTLSIENANGHTENGLQVGFTIDEMVTRVEHLLRSIGLVKNFAPLVYVIGHGSSSVNNPHYAAYDCGACSGRPGSVNARVVSAMANLPAVRQRLAERDIVIPETTQFVGGLHDTTRDEISFYDENLLLIFNKDRHERNKEAMNEALALNAKERSRRFQNIDTKADLDTIREKVRLRSVSLFEPRPELNHATNALCIVGRRALSQDLFLDRRSFMNSYDYRVDPDGKYLLNILKAAAPVCGGINLEYFFSRVDNTKLGAGTKLPHNVIGLFGVANGTDGDLRPGLPSQMIEVHDPLRLLIIVEHYPEVVLNTIQQDAATYQWFKNEWVLLVAVHPEERSLFRFRDGFFVPYHPLQKSIPEVSDLQALIESKNENLPVHLIV